MYKNLKPELEEVVAGLRIGDGVIIEHAEDYFVDRSMGYVHSINGSYLVLTKGRKPRFWAETGMNIFTSSKHYYNSFNSVTVVDPVKKKE